MPRLDLDTLLASCGPAVRKLNPTVFRAGDLPPVPVAKPSPRNGTLAAPTCPPRFTSRVLVRVTSYRVRLVDPDNIFCKWMVDALRHSRVIRDDRAGDIQFQPAQEKVATRKEGRTEILVIPLD